MGSVLVDVASGVVLLGGALACAAAALARGRWAVCAAFAAALLAALFEDGLIVACGLGAAGAALLVVDRIPAVTLLSWLDAAIGGAAAAALTVVLGGGAAPAVAAGGAVGALALSRWRPGWALPVALAGLGGLAAGPAIAPLAAFGLAGAAWLREPQAGPGPEFSRIVLGAILLSASAALALLGVGQFTDLDTAAVVLAIATVLAGMARAGLTVTDRLRESHRQAITDDLTGLGNRRHLVDRLGAAIESAAARDGQLALLLVDLDGFKELNDTLGHSAGDEVLRQIGPRLSQILREQDTLARLGGDEFAVVLAPGDEATASAAGLRLRAALEQSFGVGGIRVHVDASIGIALFPEHSRDALGLLQRADVAMYEAKRMRTGHEVYLASRDRHSRDRLLLIGELHGALRAGQLVLHYQPKADLRTGVVTGVEALVRWEHPDRGLLGPAHFLPLVEQSGLTRALTTFVLDRALDEIGERRRRGFDLTVAVNLGPADLLDLGLPSEVERLLELRGLPGREARARGVRGRRDDRRRAHRRRARRPARDRRAHRARRLRGRPRRDLPPQAAQARHAEDRPRVRDAAVGGPARRRDRPLAGGSRPPARDGRRRRGRRGRGDRTVARRVGLRRGPGTPARPSDAGRGADRLASAARPGAARRAGLPRVAYPASMTHAG